MIRGILLAELSRSLSIFSGKLNNRPETVEHTCSECLSVSEIILSQVTLMVPWGTCCVEGSEGTNKEKAYITEKCIKIQTKDNLDVS